MSRGIAVLLEQKVGAPARWSVIGSLVNYRNDMDALDS